MGPLALLDLIGLDTAYEILDTMYKQGRDRLHAPSDHQADGQRGPDRPQGGPRLWHVCRTSSSGWSPTPQTPTGGAPAGVTVRPVAKVGVVGSGTMATGIVEVFAKAGFPVVVIARGQDKVDGVMNAIGRSLAKAVDRGKLDQIAADDIAARVSGSTSRDSLADVDIVVEAIAENPDRGNSSATSTASTSRGDPRDDDIVPADHRPRQGHRPSGRRHRDALFNPAQVMRLVEVVHTVATGADVVATVVELCGTVGKAPVQCGDRSGFIVNALLFPYLNDAIKMLRGALRDRRRDRHGDEDRLRAADGPFELPRRGRARRVAGHRACFLCRVPRARVRSGTAARAHGPGWLFSAGRPSAASHLRLSRPPVRGSRHRVRAADG